MLGVRVSLDIGPGTPAPDWMIDALDSVSVDRSDECPNGFQLSFIAERTASSYTDNEILASGLLKFGSRLVISAVIKGVPVVLMDGFVTHMQLQAATTTEPARLVVTGEDVSFQMGLYDYSMEYPLEGDAVIAGIVLAKWLVLGIVPEIIPTPTSLLTFEDVPQQVGNDRDYLKSLAQMHGYVFYVSPGPVSGANAAYWGPPKRFLPPQPALTADSGSATNVTSLSFDYDATKLQRIWGAVFSPELDTEVPIATLVSTRLPPLAARSPLIFSAPYIRTTLTDDAGLDPVVAFAQAQATLDLSSDQVVTGTGTLDTLRYGRVLEAPGVVGVRGVGNSFDGNYYVQKVSHQISRKGWTQSFQLQREGLGALSSSVRV
jgi:hypothetical protein